MRIRMGSQVFADVAIPILWGTRAVLQDKKGRLSIIDLSRTEAKLEVLGNKPATGIEFRPISGGGFEILEVGSPLYSFDPATKTITGITLPLPECQISDNETRIGTNRISNSTIIGFGVGIHVMPDGGMAIGAPLPPGLAKLRV